MMTLHVIFTKDGTPGWIGPEPREGSEPVEGVDIVFLAGHRRNKKGKWVEREPPDPPTPEEIAARDAIAAKEKEEQDARNGEERDERLMRRMLKVIDQRLRGDITQAQYISRTDAIRAKFEG